MSAKHLSKIVAALLVGLALSACNPNPQPEGLTPIPTLAPAQTPTLAVAIQEPTTVVAAPVAVAAGQTEAALGAALFLKNCTVCHGVEGEGVDGPPLRNSQYIQTKGDKNVFATIAEGRAGTAMPAWLEVNGGSLTEAQITSVIAYLHTLQGVAPLPTATPMPPAPTEEPPAPGAPTPEPAQPSNPGGPGPAAAIAGDVTQGRVEFGLYCAPCHGPEGMEEVGVPNLGSDDGIVPELNPIDPTLANADSKIFAANLDLFLEHGSVPEGPSPRIMMPSFGDSKMLTEQQIADLIAYVISLNQ